MCDCVLCDSGVCGNIACDVVRDEKCDIRGGVRFNINVGWSRCVCAPNRTPPTLGDSLKCVSVGFFAGVDAAFHSGEKGSDTARPGSGGDWVFLTSLEEEKTGLIQRGGNFLSMSAGR